MKISIIHGREGRKDSTGKNNTRANVTPEEKKTKEDANVTAALLRKRGDHEAPALHN